MSSLGEGRERMLTAAREALLAKRLRGDGGGQAISRRPGDVPAPLSFVQERMWFLEKLEPGALAYNNLKACRLRGELNREALSGALGDLLVRHEALRTTFDESGATPAQRVHAAPAAVVPDFADVPAGSDDGLEAAARLGREHGHRPFDLGGGPLIRFLLVGLEDADHILFVSSHHSIMDDWAFGVLMRDLSELYRVRVEGGEPKLPELPVQYADFAHWQRTVQEPLGFQGDLDYWSEQLRGPLAVLDLPVDKPRPAMPTHRGLLCTRTLPSELSRGIKALGPTHDATLYMTLLAGFTALLQRYTGQDDIVVGSPIAGRTSVEAENLVACFINSLAMRTDLGDDPAFEGLLARVRDNALAAYSHQELPFEKLVEALEPVRNMSRSPIFQTMFQVRNVPKRDAQVGGLHISEHRYDAGITPMELLLDVVEIGDELQCRLMVSTDLFEAQTAERMLEHYEVLLTSAVGNPGLRVSELELMTEAEKHQVLVAWNQTKAELPGGRCPHEWFEENARLQPGRIAVISGDREITYAGLDAMVNRLAARLAAEGVRSGNFVGVHLPRSVECLCSLLAIFKLGAVYCPLDPAYPAQRIEFIANDARLAAIVTRAGSDESALPRDLPTVVLGDWRAWPEGADVPAPEHGPARDDLAYVFYTSGSTGEPKGVLASHGDLADLVWSMCKAYGFTSDDRMLWFSAPSFDPSLQQIMGPLVNGATVVMVHDDDWSPANIDRQMRRYGVTFTHMIASFWALVVDEWTRCPEKTRDLPLRVLATGGEVVPPDALAQWRKLNLPGTRLFNDYGPTEIVVACSAFDMSPENWEADGVRAIPIGRPLANRRLYILDQHGNPTPIGVPGELCVGWNRRFRGYLNRPALTAERFIPDPYADEEGLLLCRTGDVCRYLPDGNIDFYGRVDRQVKIRGFRVELGEIEAALETHPRVLQCAVIRRDDPAVGAQLVAYVVPVAGETVAKAPLHAHLGECLPDYMVPSVFVELVALPTTTSGKIDRAALPEPSPQDLRPQQAYQAPRTPEEKELADIFSEVLGVEKVGVHDGFFALGGHSLLAVKVTARIQDRLGVALPLREVFVSPTVAGLAEAVTLQIACQSDSEDLDALLAELEGISDEEARRLLTEEEQDRRKTEHERH